MRLSAKFIMVLSIMAGVVLFSGDQEQFSAWANDGVCNPDHDKPHLTIYHGEEEAPRSMRTKRKIQAPSR